jgi:hypothetical protein
VHEQRTRQPVLTDTPVSKGNSGAEVEMAIEKGRESRHLSLVSQTVNNRRL